MNKSTMNVELHDQSEGATASLPVSIVVTEHFIEIYPQGYGEKTAVDGHGAPVCLEFYEGQLRLIVHGDINQESPTLITSLEPARESNRVEV